MRRTGEGLQLLWLAWGKQLHAPACIMHMSSCHRVPVSPTHLFDLW